MSGKSQMSNVNKTLYIPLYGKAYVSRKGILLHDSQAEEIWSAEGFELKGKSKSKWLAYYMGMRSVVFDRWLKARMEADLTATILHIGCGLDSRCVRVGTQGHLWFDIDFPEVIAERRKHFCESDTYRMVGADIRSVDWLSRIPSGNAIIVMEGVSMYLAPGELLQTMKNMASHFDSVCLMMDCYSEFAARASKIKNPINDVGVTQVYGLDDPFSLEESDCSFIKEHEITPADLVGELQGVEKWIFKTLYAGGIAGKMYRLYEYRRMQK